MLQWMMGNWSVELGGSVNLASRKSALQVQVKLDRRELVWLQIMVGKRCIQAAAGYDGGQNLFFVFFYLFFSIRDVLLMQA